MCQDNGSGARVTTAVLVDSPNIKRAICHNFSKENEVCVPFFENIFSALSSLNLRCKIFSIPHLDLQ